MPQLKFISSSLFILVLLTACSSAYNKGPLDFAESVSDQQGRTQRRVVKSANISIEVNDPDVIAREISTLVEETQGYIESMYKYDQARIHMTVKIPSARLDVFIDRVTSQGKLLNKSIHARDVTEESIDIAAKLKNLTSLRERFRLLLEKTQKVSEILSIEKELSRIQTKIDSIEGRRKALSSQVSFSRVEVTLQQETIYGPLGYIGKGIFWFFKKLFVIQ